MELGDFGGELGEDKYQVDRVGSGDFFDLDLLQRVRLRSILRSTLENRFESGGILKLLVGIWVLVGL